MGVPISNSTFQALLQSPFCSVVRPSLTEAPRWRRAVSGLFLFSREVPFFVTRSQDLRGLHPAMLVHVTLVSLVDVGDAITSGP
jgi:hypothetical protein